MNDFIEYHTIGDPVSRKIFVGHSSTDTIQVWVEDRLVGHMGHYGLVNSGIKTSVELKPGFLLNTVERRCAFCREELADLNDILDLKDLLASKHIPAGAQEITEWRSGFVIYSWRVLQVDLDIYEVLFNADEFEPA